MHHINGNFIMHSSYQSSRGMVLNQDHASINHAQTVYKALLVIIEKLLVVILFLVIVSN